MTNRQIARLIRDFKSIRADWIGILVNNPDAQEAVKQIASINAKIELLRTPWNLNEGDSCP